MSLVPQELYERLVVVRRDPFRHPELSRQEARTAGVVSSFLHNLGVQCRTNVAGHGVVADIPGKT